MHIPGWWAVESLPWDGLRWGLSLPFFSCSLCLPLGNKSIYERKLRVRAIDIRGSQLCRQLGGLCILWSPQRAKLGQTDVLLFPLVSCLLAPHQDTPGSETTSPNQDLAVGSTPFAPTFYPTECSAVPVG